MAKRDKWTIAGMKRLIRDNTPESGVDEEAVVALIQANIPAPPPTSNVLVLGPQDPIPANTPAGTVIAKVL